jgi:hypothetical protein
MTLPRPQRIIPPSAVGSLLKRAGVPTRSRISPEERNPDYLALVRQCPCLSCGLDPCGEAAHVRFASAAFGKASGMQKKPEDRWALPVCGWDHRIVKTAQHQRNEEQFWADLGINPLITCERLYAQSGDMVAMRAVVFVTIAERGK